MTTWRDDHEHDEPEAESLSAERYGPAPVQLPRGSSLAMGLLMVVAAVGLWRAVLFVDQTEYVYVTQFGQPVRLHTRPGLQWKWPWQSVWRFDRRLRLLEPPAREMLTEDKENLNIEWYACWRLAGSQTSDEPAAVETIEPSVRRFLQAVGSMATAEVRLEERLQAAVAAEFGKTRMSQLVSLDPDNGVQWDAITRRVLEAVQPLAREQFGIDLVDVRIRRFGYPESVKPAVFAEIRSERERVAVQYRAEGASRKTKIESLAALQRDQIMAQAQREATALRGEGDAKAIEILNQAHGKNPQFYELLKTLETYRVMLDDQTTIVLSPDSPLLKLLTQGIDAPVSSAPPSTLAPGKTTPMGEATPKEPPTPAATTPRATESSS